MIVFNGPAELIFGCWNSANGEFLLCSLLRSNQSKMTNLLLPEGPTTKAKEAGNFAFLITDVAIPDGMGRVDVAGYLAAAGIYCHEGDMAYGTDGSDSRNERMFLKVVGHLGDSANKKHAHNTPTGEGPKTEE